MMSKWTICIEKTRDSLIFGEWPEPFSHSRSFVMSDLSNSLTSLFKNEGMSELLTIFKLPKKCTKNMILFKFFLVNCLFLWVKERLSNLLKKTSNLLICSLTMSNLSSHSFVMSNLSNLLTIAHLSWATWAISSLFLICPEQSEQMAQSCSLQWAIFFSKWAMSEWANEQIPTLKSSKKPPKKFLSYENQPKFVLTLSLRLYYF